MFKLPAKEVISEVSIKWQTDKKKKEIDGEREKGVKDRNTVQ